MEFQWTIGGEPAPIGFAEFSGRIFSKDGTTTALGGDDFEVLDPHEGLFRLLRTGEGTLEVSGQLPNTNKIVIYKGKVSGAI